MRKLVLFLAAITPFALQAQTVATFEAPVLSKIDTYYVVSNPVAKVDVGFNNGLAHFPTYFDTSGGYSYQSRGFTISSKTDSVTSGYTNGFSAKAAKGYGGSAQYASVYGGTNKIMLTGAAVGKNVNGFYITNATYAYNSMRSGDAFARKFGDTTGTHSGLAQGSYPDWFKLQIRGYRSGALTTDSVDFYLADYRSATNKYIIKDWNWVNLLPLGHVDSLQLTLKSSDVGTYGMNTPAYYCIDNFTTNETALGIGATPASIAKVYPIPAKNQLTIELKENTGVNELSLYDVAGHLVRQQTVNGTTQQMDISGLTAGIYILQFSGNDGKIANLRVVKQ